MIIRRETEKDFDLIYDLVKVAFKTAHVSNGKEQDFVNQLRSSSGYIPELALVAEENGKLIGHIMLTKKYVVDNDNKYEMLYLAPISVELEYRNKGIGSALIKESFMLAEKLGYKSVILVGNPAYYHRFGFKSASNFGIKHSPATIPDECVMGCELIPNALNGVNGMVEF